MARRFLERHLNAGTFAMKAGRVHPAAMPLAYGSHLATTRTTDYLKANPKKALVTSLFAAGIPATAIAVNKLKNRWRKQKGGTNRWLQRYKNADSFAEKVGNHLGPLAIRPAFTAHLESAKLADLAKANPKITIPILAAAGATGLGLGLNKLRKRKRQRGGIGIW